MKKNFANKAYATLFYDKNGRLVLWQWPNLPLVIWGICIVLGKLTQNNLLQTTFSWLGFLALLYWALLELLYGVNYFRRILGLIVIVVIISYRFI